MHIAVVAGASHGIGASVSLLLAKQGYNLALLARTALALEDTASSCKQANGSIQVFVKAIDCCNDEVVQDAIADIASKGDIVLFVHCVASFRREASIGSFEILAGHVRTNLVSAVVCARAVLPHMLRHKNGSLVFVTSKFAKLLPAVPGLSSFVSSMNGVASFAQCLFAEARHHGLSVSTVYVGLANTKVGLEMKKELGMLFNNKVKVEELIQPEDVAKAVLYATTPTECNISEIAIEPQRDVYRYNLYKEVERVNKMLTSQVVHLNPQKVAFITGAGKGIGRNVAVNLAARGYDVILVSRTLNDLQITADACVAARPACRTLILPLDLSIKENVEAAVKKGFDEFGYVDCIVSNAGVNRRKNSALASVEIWDEIMQTNLLGAMRLVRLTLPSLMTRVKSTNKATHVIFINSTFAHPRAAMVPGVVPYASSKCALAAFAKVVMEDVRDWGVKVSTIFPGLVDTDMGNRAGPVERQSSAFKQGKRIPPEDVAKAVCFILDSAASSCPVEIHIDMRESDFPGMREGCYGYVENALAKL